MTLCEEEPGWAGIMAPLLGDTGDGRVGGVECNGGFTWIQGHRADGRQLCNPELYEYTGYDHLSVSFDFLYENDAHQSICVYHKELQPVGS